MNEIESNEQSKIIPLFSVKHSTKMSLWCGIFGWILIILCILLYPCLADDVHISGETIIRILLPILFIGSIIFSLISVYFGIFTILQIAQRKKRLQGNGKTVFGLLLSVILWLLIGTIIIPELIRERQYRDLSYSIYRARRIAFIILMYEDNYEKYPEPNRWCDILLEYDPCDKNFLQPEKTTKEKAHQCIYALNPNCEPNSPPDTVLLFETKSGWNKYGGPELLTFDNHKKEGAAVGFNDGHAQFVKPEDANKLKWK